MSPRPLLLAALALLALAPSGLAQARSARPASGWQARVDDASTWVVVEGDILVPGGSVARSSWGGSAWPGGVVPYLFHTSTTPANQVVALDAMAEWAARADLTFVPRTSEPNYIYVWSGGGNLSPVGMIGGGQILRITAWNAKYTVVHEFGHALGLWHEQTRHDRDDHIDVRFENMLSAAVHNYDPRPNGGDHGPYDFASVMHYGACTASICTNCATVPGCETTVPRLQYGRFADVLGQRSYVSDGDARGMAFRYGFSHPDCDGNGVDDAFDLLAGDCNGNGLLDACEPDCNGNGKPDACDIAGGVSLDANGDQVPDECAGAVTTLYVDAAATAGANDGTSWADAFQDLQDALALARAAPGTVDEVWVAGGVHRPGTLRSDAFELVNGVALYGGFAGGETARDERDPAAHPTWLDGDLAGDDGPAFANRGDNSRHVLVAAPGTDASAVLDGFVVRGGNADDGSDGGGLACAGAPTIRGCRFEDNEAARGGAVSIADADAVVASCRFVANRAGRGGAVFTEGGWPVLLNCAFEGNASTSLSGGAVACEGGGAWVASSTFHGNAAATFGGGVAYAGPSDGGVVLRNCILWANVDAGGVDETAQLDRSAGTLEVNHCCVQGWTGALGGAGNLGDDPLFVDAPGGDLRLATGSPCIDAGEGVVIPKDLADLDRDGVTFEDVPFDLAGAPRFLGGWARDPGPIVARTLAIIDLGAYEHRSWGRMPGQAEAGGITTAP